MVKMAVDPPWFFLRSDRTCSFFLVFHVSEKINQSQREFKFWIAIRFVIEAKNIVGLNNLKLIKQLLRVSQSSFIHGKVSCSRSWSFIFHFTGVSG